MLEVYSNYAIRSNDNNKTSYASALKLLHSMLKVSILHCQKFISNITKVGYEVNLYDLHAASKITNAR